MSAMADACGVDRRTIFRWLGNPEQKIHITVARQIVMGLGLPQAKILGRAAVPIIGQDSLKRVMQQHLAILGDVHLPLPVKAAATENMAVGLFRLLQQTG